MDYKGKRILVLDGYGRQIPTILKQLHDLGCVITTVNDSKLDIGATSRYPHKKIIIKGCKESAEVLRNFLEESLKNNAFDIIFPVLEKTTDLLLTLKEEGKTGDVKIICAPRDAFMKAYDKQQTLKLCMENGIPCPLTKLDNESLETYISKVKFPLACKPRKGSGSAGFRIAQNREHLEAMIADGTIIVEDYVLQEYIPHTDYHYGAYLMFGNDGNPVYSVVVQSCRQYPIDGGPGCYIRTVNNEQIKKDSEKLLKVLGWQGFGHVGLIMDPRDGVAKVMEINGRIPAGIKICNCVGVPSIKILLDFVYGQPTPYMNINIPEYIGMRHFQADFMWFLKSPQRFNAKPSWFNFCHSYDYVFSWSDPMPFFSYSLEHAMTYREDMKKRQH